MFLERIRMVLSNVEFDVFVSFLFGCNLFFLKEMFEVVGKFFEYFFICEDYFFIDKVNKLGELFYIL